MNDGFFLDMSNVSDQGFSDLPVGRYVVATQAPWFIYVKEETGNPVLRIPLEVVSGDHAKETTAVFHALTDKSKGFLLVTLRTLGIIQDGDREKDPTNFGIKLVYGRTTERDEKEVVAVQVGNERRDVGNRQAVAVVVLRDNKAVVDKLEPVGAANAANPGQSSPGSTAAGNRIPF